MLNLTHTEKLKVQNIKHVIDSSPSKILEGVNAVYVPPKLRYYTYIYMINISIHISSIVSPF